MAIPGYPYNGEFTALLLEGLEVNDKTVLSLQKTPASAKPQTFQVYSDPEPFYP